MKGRAAVRALVAVAGVAFVAVVAAAAEARLATHAIEVDVAADASAFTVEERLGTDGPRAEILVGVPAGSHVVAVTAGNASGPPVPWAVERRGVLRIGPVGDGVVVLRYTAPGGPAPAFSKPFLEEVEAALVIVRVPDELALAPELRLGSARTREVFTAEPERVLAAGPVPVGEGDRVGLALSPLGTAAGRAAVGAAGVAFFVVLVVMASLRVRRHAEARGEMTLLDHARELRRRLLVTLAVLAVATLAFLSLGVRLVDVGPTTVPVPRPGTSDSVSAVVFGVLAARYVPEGVQIVVTSPFDAVFAQLQVAMLMGVLVTLPVAAYQASMFLAPGLTGAERRTAARAVVPAVGLFLLGALFGSEVLLPFTMRLLYGYAVDLGAVPLLPAGELVSLVLLVCLSLGAAFELPLVMAVLVRAGLVAPGTMRKGWRTAIVGIFVLAAVITPDPTVVGQLLLAGPLLVLYGAGIIAAEAAGTRSARRDEEREL